MQVTDVTPEGNVYTRYRVVGKNGKAVQITDFQNSWSLKYPNGNIKNFNEYHEAIDWLAARGY